MSFGDPSWQSWVLDEEASLPFIKRALELGVNFFDTADMYSRGVSETVLGNCLKKLGVNREDVVIATKVFFLDKPINGDIPDGCLSRKHIMASIDNSLRRLQVDYVDLYQIHRWDKNTPIEETMEALHDIVKSGKARYIGASTMYAWQFAKAQKIAEQRGWTKFVSMQNHYNLSYREEEREMNPQCIDMGVGLIPWSPLARGFLTGSRKRDQQHPTIRSKIDAPYAEMLYFKDYDWPIVDRVVELAKEKGVTAAQVALAWLLHKPGVVAPIVGVTKMAHLEQAVEALKIKLTDKDMKFLEELYKPHPMLGFYK